MDFFWLYCGMWMSLPGASFICWLFVCPVNCTICFPRFWLCVGPVYLWYDLEEANQYGNYLGKLGTRANDIQLQMWQQLSFMMFLYYVGPSISVLPVMSCIWIKFMEIFMWIFFCGNFYVNLILYYYILSFWRAYYHIIINI